jgi:hypothetical protein
VKCQSFAASRETILREFPNHDPTRCPNEATRTVQFDHGTQARMCDFHADEIEALGPPGEETTNG